MESKIQKLYTELIDLFLSIPSLQTVRERNTFFDVLGLSEEAKSNINWEGATRPFVASLLEYILLQNPDELHLLLRTLTEEDISISNENRETAASLLQQVQQINQEEWKFVFFLPDIDHNDVRQSYLHWMIKQHQYLEIPQSGLKNARIALDRVYVALRGDQSNEHERSANREWLNRLVEAYTEHLQDELVDEEERDYIRWRILARAPITKSIEERDRPQLFAELNSKVITLGEAFQQERRLVILGDPGSGKTTLARWLALRMSQSLINKEKQVLVQAGQINPQAIDPSELISLGPARLPILIRVSEFAQAWNNYNGSLYEFIGAHTWAGRKVVYPEGHALQGKEIPEAALKWIMQYHIRRREAVIILDGLDEIASLGNRDEVVQSINQFMDSWIDDLIEFTEDSDLKDAPVTTGGNQIVVTSRITGYYASHLIGNLAHVTIEPMIDEAVTSFCDSWVTAVYEARNETTIDSSEVQREAEGLKREIFDPTRRGVRDLASNPLLITVLASIYLDQRFNNPAELRAYLPEQRVELYDIAVKNLAKVWKKRSHNGQSDYEDLNKVIAVMVPLAANIHENHHTGLISFQEVKLQISRYLMRYLGVEEISPQFEEEVSTFLQNLSNEVGLFAERGEHLYGFLHLTFQEYLAGRFLTQQINDVSGVKNAILQKIDIPRWREPILLGLGHMSTSWHPQSVRDLLLALITEDTHASSHLPRGALLVTAALQEMRNVPNEIILELANLYLTIYQNQEGKGRFKILIQQIEIAFDRLRYGRHVITIDQFLIDHLKKPTFAPAAAKLILKNEWFTNELTQALIKALPLDTLEWEWVIHKAVQKIITQHLGNHRFGRRPVTLEEVEAGQWIPDTIFEGLTHVRCLTPRQIPNRSDENNVETFHIPRALFPFRLQLQYNPKLIQWIESNPHFLRLVIALYGGFGNYGLNEIMDEYHQIKQQLQFGGGDEDERRELSIRLDTFLHPQVQTLLNKRPYFDVNNIYRDSPITPVLVAAFREQLSVDDLITILKQELEQIDAPGHQADLLLALAMLNHNIRPILDSINNETLMYLQENVLRLQEYIGDSILRASTGFMELMKKPSPSSSPDLWWGAVESLIETNIAYGGDPLNPWQLFQENDSFINSSIRNKLISEMWMHNFAGASDDLQYNLAVILDTIGKPLTQDLQAFTASFANAHRAKNNNWPYHRGWKLEKIQPIHRTPLYEFLDGLQAISTIPENLGFVRGWVLRNLKPIILEAYPDLIGEAITIALSTLNNNDGFDSLNDALEKLAPHLINAADPYDEIFTLADSIPDPEQRARLFFRLALLFSRRRADYLKKVLSDAYEIEDPLRRSRLLEQLIPILKGDREPILEEITRSIEVIEDPNNKARMLLRLSLNYDLPLRRHHVERALDAIGEIEKIDELADILQLIRKQMAFFPELQAQWERLCGSIEDQTYLRIARQQLSPRLLEYVNIVEDVSKETGLIWSTATLGALLHDLAQEIKVNESIEKLWLQLVDADEQPTALQKLVEHGAKQGLPLTIHAANAVDHLVEANASTLLSSLLPLLTTPDVEIVPIVERWFTQSQNKEVAQYAALLLVESEHFSPDTITSVVLMLNQTDDRTRHRAALALHGSDRSEKIRVSTLGSDSMYRIKELSREINQPRVQLVLSWMEQRILHDDPDMIHQWAAQVGNAETLKNDEAAAALGIIRKIENVTSPVWTVLMHYLREGQSNLRAAILESIVRLAIIQWSDTYVNYEPTEFDLLRHLIRDILVSDEVMGVRKQAAEALGYIGLQYEDYLAFQTVIEYEDNNSLKHEALIGLGRMIGRIEKRMTRLVVNNQYWIQLNANKSNLADEYRARENVSNQAKQNLSQLLTWRKLLEEVISKPETAQWAAEGLIWSNAQVSSVMELIQHDSITLLHALLGSCRTRYVSTQYRIYVQRASEYLEQQPILLDLLLELIDLHFSQEGDVYQDTAPEYELSLKLSVAAAAAERMPAKFLELVSKYNLRKPLSKAVTLHNTFPGRTAAITLLSFMRELEDDVMNAVQYALHDVYDVQNGAMAAIIRFQDFARDKTFLNRLMQDLYHSSTVNAYITSQVLTIIGRNDTIDEKDHAQIIDALRQAIDDPRSQRHVYIMDGNGSGHYRFMIRHLGRLDDLYFDALTKITGLDTLYFTARNRENVEARTRTFELPMRQAGEEIVQKVQIGESTAKSHPLQFQSNWYSSSKGTSINNAAMKAIEDLGKIAVEKDVLLSDLLEHAVFLAKKRKQQS